MLKISRENALSRYHGSEPYVWLGGGSRRDHRCRGGPAKTRLRSSVAHLGASGFDGKDAHCGPCENANGTGRVIPINDDLGSVATHRAWFVKEFGEPLADHFLFPWGKPVPSDPARHATDITWGWDELRKDAGVRCRLHDLRHTFATRLAENGVSESTMLALMGHMSRSMLERYSHIRMTAKRDAVAGGTLSQKGENSEVVPVIVPVVGQSGRIQ